MTTKNMALKKTVRAQFLPIRSAFWIALQVPGSRERNIGPCHCCTYTKQLHTGAIVQCGTAGTVKQTINKKALHLIADKTGA